MLNIKFSTLKEKILYDIKQIDDKEIIFTTICGKKYLLFHEQDCCENVTINDVCGDYKDLLGYPLLIAEEVQSEENPNDFSDIEYQDYSFTWTFYKLSTIKGSVTIRWYGESNGYYSESVSLREINEDENGI